MSDKFLIFALVCFSGNRSSVPHGANFSEMVLFWSFMRILLQADAGWTFSGHCSNISSFPVIPILLFSETVLLCVSVLLFFPRRCYCGRSCVFY